MDISHDVLAVFLLAGGSFESRSIGRLVAVDRTCRRLAGCIWRDMRFGQVRRLLSAYYDRVIVGFPKSRPPTVAYLLLRMNYLHDAEIELPVALSPIRLHLAEQIRRLALGLAEAVTPENCGTILLEIDSMLNGELRSGD